MKIECCALRLVEIIKVLQRVFRTHFVSVIVRDEGDEIAGSVISQYSTTTRVF